MRSQAAKVSKSTPQQNGKVGKNRMKSQRETSNIRESRPLLQHLKNTTNVKRSDDVDDSFRSPIPMSDASTFYLDYTDNAPMILKKPSKELKQQLYTATPKKGSSRQNVHRNSADDSSNKENVIESVPLSDQISEDLEETDDDVLQTSDFTNGFDTFFDSPDNSFDSKLVNESKITNLPRKIVPQNENRKPRKSMMPRKLNKTHTHMDKVIAAHMQHTGNVLPKRSFQRLVLEILRGHGDYRISKVSLDGLQEAAEVYMSQLFQDAYLITYHRKSKTLLPKDVEMVLYLRGCNDPGNA